MALRSTLRTIGRTFNLFASATRTLCFVISKRGAAVKMSTQKAGFSIWSMCFAMLLFSVGTPSCGWPVPTKHISVSLLQPSEAAPDLQAAVDAWNAACPMLFRVVPWNRGLNGSDIIVVESRTQPEGSDALAHNAARHIVVINASYWTLDAADRARVLVHELGHVMTDDHLTSDDRSGIMEQYLGYAAHELTEEDLDLVRARGYCLK